MHICYEKNLNSDIYMYVICATHRIRNKNNDRDLVTAEQLKVTSIENNLTMFVVV